MSIKELAKRELTHFVKTIQWDTLLLNKRNHFIRGHSIKLCTHMLGDLFHLFIAGTYTTNLFATYLNSLESS